MELPDYGAAVSGTAVVGDRMNLAMLGNPANLVPFLAGDSGAATIGGSIYQSLLTYDGDLNLVPEVAESFKVSVDNLAIEFKLRRGVVFSDGSPLTSADVSATFHAITNPTTRTPYADDYLRVVKFETPDPYTVRVRYAEPFAPALSSWAGLPILPAKVIALDADFNQTRLKEQPLGSGSYRLAQWRREQDFLLVANEKSTRAPWIGQLYYRVIPDQSTQWLELKAGNLDMLELTPLAYTRLIDGEWFTRQYSTYRALSNSYVYMGFNLKRAPFDDKRVRQALSYAVDREGIIKAVLFGQGEPIASIFKPGTWAYNTKLAPYPFDPAKARALLEAAGWRVGADGVRVKEFGNCRKKEKEIAAPSARNDGYAVSGASPLNPTAKCYKKRLAFTLVTNQGNEGRLKTAQILQSMFADVGVKMEIRVQEWSSFLTNTVNPRDFDAIMLGWTLPAEPDPFDVWHSSKTKPGEFNIVGFSNAEADREIVASRRVFDQAERKVHLDRLQEILHEEQPYLWLYAPYSLTAVHRRVQGIEPKPAGLGWNSEQWWVPKEWVLRESLVP